MREKLDKILQSIFSIFILVAILGGGVIFLMFVVAIIVGGETGGEIAANASDVVIPYFIKSASIAMVAGLLSFYNKKSHALSLEDKDDEGNLSPENC